MKRAAPRVTLSLLLMAASTLWAADQPARTAWGSPDSLEPAVTAKLNHSGRDAILLRAENGQGLVGFLPEGAAGWRMILYPMTGSVAAFTAADFDGDGTSDLAIMKSGGEFATMLGDGQGGFTLKSNSRGVLAGFTPITLRVDDLNGDGKPDLSLYDGKRRLDLKNDGYGNLEAAAAAKAVPPLAAMDLTADFSGSGATGRIEVYSDRVVIRPALGGTPVALSSRYAIRAAVVGNFTGGGGPELALISYGERPRLQIISAARGKRVTTEAASFLVTFPEIPAATCSIAATFPTWTPPTCNINVSDTVSWTGLAAFHTVTSIDSLNCALACNGKFCSPAGASSYSHQFLSASEGSIFKCNPHCASGMTGTVNVSAPATPGTVPATGTPFRVAKSATAGNLDLTWGVSCSATATKYNLYQGTLPSSGTLAAYNHTAKSCVLGNVTATTITPAAGSTYYLVVAATASNEGSYGKNSANAEIPPPGTGECLPQNLTGSC